MSDDNLYAPPSADLVDTSNGGFAVPVLDSPDIIKAFGRTWRLFSDHLGALLTLTLVVAVPLHAAKALLYTLVPEGTPDAAFRALDILDALGDGLIIPSAIYLVAEAARSGERPDLGSALSWGVRRFVPFVLARLLAGLATGLATCLLIVPGVYVGIRLALVDVVVSLEAARGDALSASWRVVEGRWWHTLGAYLLLGLVVYTPLGVLGAGLGVATVAAQDGLLGPESAALLPAIEAGLVFSIGIASAFAKVLLGLLGLVLYNTYRHEEAPDGWVEDLSWR